MKTHVTHSVELVRAANGPSAGVEEIIMQHHERQDGTGYPRWSQRLPNFDGRRDRGLADTFSALTSVRPFAEPVSPSNALNLLHSHAGSSSTKRSSSSSSSASASIPSAARSRSIRARSAS